MQTLGTVPAMATGAFAPPAPDLCASMSYQYDCVVGTAHVGTVCVPLCPNSAGAPPCIPCEDVRANCAWVRTRRPASLVDHHTLLLIMHAPVKARKLPLSSPEGGWNNWKYRSVTHD